MNKQILSEYVDACELIKETEKKIEKLEKQQKAVHHASVSGSNPEFPYERKHIHIEGRKCTLNDDTKIRYEKQLLEKRKQKAEEIKLKVQQFLNELSPRLQRIISMHYFEGKTWGEIAKVMGRKATADSIRKEVDRIFEKK